MERNVELLNKTADRIEAIPESYTQGEYQARSADAPCGTAACLAGEIIICAAPNVEVGLRELGHAVRIWEADCELSNPGLVAGGLAGLTKVEVDALFNQRSSWMWPEPFRSQWFHAETKHAKAGAAAGLLRYLASGGKVPKGIAGRDYLPA